MTRKQRQLRAKLIIIAIFAILCLIHAYKTDKPTVSLQIHQIALERQLSVNNTVAKSRNVVSRSVTRIPLGVFEITAYTAGFESCGKLPSDPAYGITKSGAKVQEHHTIAADWTVLPKGTKIMIEGSPHTYTVEDVGGAIKGKKIDIYMESLSDAQEFGRQKLKVWVVE